MTEAARAAHAASIAEEGITTKQTVISEKIDALTTLLALMDAKYHPRILSNIARLTRRLEILTRIYEENCIRTEYIACGNDLENTPTMNVLSVDPIVEFCTDEVWD